MPCNSAKRFKPDPGASGGNVCTWGQPNLQTPPSASMGPGSAAGLSQQFQANGPGSLYNRSTTVLSPYYPGNSPGGPVYLNVSKFFAYYYESVTNILFLG